MARWRYGANSAHKGRQGAETESQLKAEIGLLQIVDSLQISRCVFTRLTANIAVRVHSFGCKYWTRILRLEGEGGGGGGDSFLRHNCFLSFVLFLTFRSFHLYLQMLSKSSLKPFRSFGPKGGRAFLTSPPPGLESQGCHLVLSFHRLSCSYAYLVLLLLLSSPFSAFGPVSCLLFLEMSENCFLEI